MSGFPPIPNPDIDADTRAQTGYSVILYQLPAPHKQFVACYGSTDCSTLVKAFSDLGRQLETRYTQCPNGDYLAYCVLNAKYFDMNSPVSRDIMAKLCRAIPDRQIAVCSPLIT